MHHCYSTSRPGIEPLESRIAPALLFAVETSTSANKLVSFDSAAPGTLLSDVTITGLQATEEIVEIQFRPADGKLYGIGVVDDGATRSGRFYQIDVVTGAATLAGSSPFSTALPDTNAYGMDFDPAKDQLRLISSTDANYRLIPTLNFAASDTDVDEVGFNEAIVAVGYDHNFNSPSTTLYGYNFLTDEIVRIGDVNGTPSSANNGVVTPIGRAKVGGIDYTSNSSLMGFDIAGPLDGQEQAWLVSRSSAAGVHLYKVDLATAALTDMGAVGSGTRLFGGISVKIDADAPAISADGKTATWTDLDGDLVTLKVSTGGLTADNFRMLPGTNGTALSRLTISNASFTGANVSITAKPGLNGGDGRVNVGWIDATGIDLGAVTVPGDLVKLDAGDANKLPPSAKTLTLGSVNAFGEGLLGGASDASRIFLADGAGAITIAGDMAGALLLGKAKTGSLIIGGDVIGAGSSGHGNIANDPAASLGKLVINGSIRASGFFNVAQVFPKNVGSVKIGGSIIGAGGNASGYVNITGTGKTIVTIGGSLIGGGSSAAGSVSFDKIAMLKIGGSLIGGTSSSSGYASVSGIAVVSVKGDLIGSSGFYTGTVIGGGMPADFLKSLTIGGSVTSGTNSLAITATRIGSLKIAGSVTGSAAAPVIIAAPGLANPATAAESVAIGKVSIAGNLSFGQIVAGSDGFLNEKNVDVAIGSVFVGKNMEASSIVAGITPKTGGFGDADDAFVNGSKGNSAIVSAIGKVTVAGQIYGTFGGAIDSFGIEAERIGSITIGTSKVKLKLGDDNEDLFLGFTSDVHVREF